MHESQEAARSAIFSLTRVQGVAAKWQPVADVMYINWAHTQSKYISALAEKSSALTLEDRTFGYPKQWKQN